MGLQEEISQKILQWAEEVVMTDLGKELVLKGRTSDYKKSKLIAGAEITFDGKVVNIWMPNYWQYVEYGVPASRIPYDPHKKRGDGKDKSKYISALIRWLGTKGKTSTDPRTKNIAFAIAGKQKKEGNPINKGKLNFISATIRKNGSKWTTALEKIIGKKLEEVIYAQLSSSESQIK
jgi:hypothetical protein